MADLDEIEQAVLDVLSTTAGEKHDYLDGYRILARMKDAPRGVLINEYGEPGKEAERHYTAVSRIAQIARGLEEKGLVEHDWLDARGLRFEWQKGSPLIDAGAQRIGIYRLKR